MSEPDDPIAVRVAHDRWFWLLLLRHGPVRDQDDETAERIQRAHLAHLFELEATGRLQIRPRYTLPGGGLPEAGAATPEG